MTEASKYGLELHPDKTKILSSCKRRAGRAAQAYIDINGKNIEILRIDANAKYLGRNISFLEPHDTEISNRIAMAWRKFSMLRQELTSKSHSLKDRIRLFHGTVTPTILYGSACWTMTQESRRRLRTCQRRMLRLIVGSRRRRVIRTVSYNKDEHDTSNDSGSDVSSNPCKDGPVCKNDAAENDENEYLEPWADFMKRTTREAEAKLEDMNIEEWTTTQRRKKWNFAGRVAKQGQDRWSNAAARWNPQITSDRTCRIQGRPKKRWHEDLDEYLQRSLNNDGISWMNAAKDEELWTHLKDGYISSSNP